mmetsp:Transcript_9588/g.14360  ORF Transcript_9588/g.14360 Transcript_9588/m.14360 type:complete len:80 (+) Transcript_9588:132-371(+)|eukprot:CAMPEP_0197737012 /NCGR_PEP_ID=MMETSP1435-20131217/6532_1 /TAXON_ID=426625 /ORGANISM="Chaetoceros brevis, Strain CCMP164" /LENGTH=79 /DNA_ID=CAMNT_0043325371 /DNA_START=86 /DNA_END=325 /DNA_ORIENTATION=-
MVEASSENAVNRVMQKGIVERGSIYVAAGLTIGALASVVLSPGGKGTAARKVITAFGAGVGLGSAWTRTNMDLEEMLDK